MKRIFQSGLGVLLLLIALTYTSAAYGQCSDLFISEYVEGNLFNKAIELYNPTPYAIDLSNYRLIRWDNGSTDADLPGGDGVLNLVGTINAYSTHVMAIYISFQGHEICLTKLMQHF
jgi:predicted extracellular nuclease